MKTNKKIFFLIFFSVLCGCYRVEDKIDTKISYHLKEEVVKSLKNPFKPLTPEERSQDWAKEFIIAKKFAKELDLYRAVTNFKRAEILLDENNTYRKQEIEYNILLCYYLGKKYDDVVDTFEKSTLCYVDKSFKAFEDLLIILYESYHELKNEEKTKKILELLEDSYPEMEKKIKLSTALMDADVNTLSKDYGSNPQIKQLINKYAKEKKSTQAAQALNVFIPGSGYLYVGQTRAAITAFLLNAAFIYASYEFFKNGWTAAGVITASFEAGWYFGGVYGAGEAANFYNERTFENLATPMLTEKKLFPIFFLKYGF
jgi:hypothetical protein